MNRLSHLIIAFLSLAALSCVREDIPYEDTPSSATGTAEVSLDLFVARENAGTAETKAVDDPADFASTKIRNLNILQFKGTDDSSEIVGEVRYLSDTADPDDEEKFLNMNKIRLADSQGELHTLVILANTFTKLPQVENLGEMRRLFRTIDSNHELFGHEGDGLDFPDKGTTEYLQRLNAIAVTKVENGTIVTGALRRSMAKIQIHIENDGTDELCIQKIQLMNISQKDYYITDYRYVDPATSEIKKLHADAFQDIYDPDDPKRISYQAMDWNGNSDGTGSADYTFYVPANQRGVYADNYMPQDKNKCPNADGATYVRIVGAYGPSGDCPIIYTFYLGGNLYNDFNLKPNTCYQYNFKFSGKGDGVADSRIEDMGTVDFDVDANCYMLNPPLSHTRSYSFNAIHRPNIFWKERYELYKQYPNYTIDNTKTWNARVLWSDFEMTQDEANAFLVKRHGDGSGNYMDDSQRIKVTVPAGMQPGNVAIGMYIDDPENILWSWHLWITDYEPDNIKGHVPVDGKYVYPVTGGEVHRYAGLSWTDENGRYRKGYAMDRNLGAIDSHEHWGQRGGGMVYQFGRKDPFIGGSYAIWFYDASGNATKYTASTLPSANMSTPELAASNGANVPFSVNRPTLLISTDGNLWNYNDQFSPSANYTSVEWNDPKATDRKDNEELGKNADKSIFDPCPQGWRLPRADKSDPLKHCYEGFSDDNKGNATTDPTVNYVKLADPYGRGSGYTYFPAGPYLSEREKPEPQTAFFPFSGMRYKNGTYDSGGGWKGWYWTASTAGQTSGYTLMVARWTASGTYEGQQKTYALPVRCVREDY